MPRSLPTLELDGFCLRPAVDPAQGAAAGALCRLRFELGFIDQNGRDFTHHQSLWVVVTGRHAGRWLGVLLEAPFLFLHDDAELLAIGTELPFLPCHIAEVLPEAALGPAERSVASQPARRRWAA